ncbi:MAG: hypothetical protein JKY42_00090, partial [Flavobacteriales bacterium]|nr:hypothetical protein [Flavobacteriales bacterium]
MSKISQWFVVFTSLLLGACNLSVENSGGGVVTSLDGKINCGDICKINYSTTSDVSLVATPESGYIFDGWSGSCSGNNGCTVSIGSTSGDKTVSAQFSLKPVSNIAISTTPTDLRLAPDEKGNISTGVNFTTTSEAPVTVMVSQQVTPIWGSNDGISLTPSSIDGFVSSTDKVVTYEQEISAYSNGVYEITTTTEIVETGDTAVSVIRISVASPSEVFDLGIPSSTPRGLVPGALTPVTFITDIRSTNTTEPIAIVLSGDVNITMNDEGSDGDRIAGDGYFTGTTIVDTTGLSAGTCLSVTTTATQGITTATSGAHKLCISSFPLNRVPSDMTNPVADPVSGQPAIADEVMIQVAQGTSESVINQIATSVGGVVIGSIVGLDIYQIKLQIRVSNSAELAQIISDLESLAEVLAAEANVIDSELGDKPANKPNDEKFQYQYGLDKIRAAEAWYVV